MTQRGQHTWSEINGQPEAWRSTIEAFVAEQPVLEDFLNQVDFNQILIVGCGSTHYLAQTAAATLTHYTHTPSYALPSSELWLFPHTAPLHRTLLITISRSGTTTETLRAMEHFRKTCEGSVLAITCYPESPLSQQADFTLAALAGQEKSVAQTRSFTSMLLLTQALAATLTRDDGMLIRLHRLPNLLDNLVAKLADLPKRLGTNPDIDRIFFLGGGPFYGLANEAMLKTKEISLSYAEAYHPLEFRHGPMSMANERTLVVGLLSDTGLAQELRVLKDMQGFNARTLALIEDGSALSGWHTDQIIELSSGLIEWEREPLLLPALQLMAYHRAMEKGLDPDRPNNLQAVIQL